MASPVLFGLLITYCSAVPVGAECAQIHVQVGAKNVTLPCTYNISSSERFNISWYRWSAVNSVELVLRVDRAGNLYPGPNHTDRVVITRRTDLVLKFPRISDSSNYTWELLATLDNADTLTTAGFVYLNVIGASKPEKILLFLLCIVNGIAIIGTILGVSLVGSRYWRSLATDTRLQLVVVTFCVLTPCALSTVLLTFHLANPSHANFRIPGVILGATGIGVTCVAVVTLITVSCKDGIKFRRTGSELYEPSRHPHTLGDYKQKQLEEKSKLLRHTCDKDHHLFVPTGAYHAAKKGLRHSTAILLLGNSGDGKSTILKRLCLDFLEKNQLVLSCDDPFDIAENLPDNKKALFIFDDPFGSIYAVQCKVAAWIHWEASSSLLQKRMKAGHIKIAFACRTSVWNECQESLHEIPFFRRIVDVSAIGLTPDMKRDMINKHIGLGFVQQSKEGILEEIINNDQEKHSDQEMVMGFPLSCSIAGTIVTDTGNTQNNEAQHVEALQNSSDFIRRQFKQLSSCDPWMYVSLVLILLNNGSLPCEELNNENVNERFKEKLYSVLEFCEVSKLERSFGTLRFNLNKLDGTYLSSKTSADGKFYSFIHAGIFEILAFEYGEEHMDQMEKYCDPDFIEYLVRKRS